MNKHDLKQQYVFLCWINKVLKDDFVSMQVRSLGDGMDLPIKKYAQDLDPPEESAEHLWECLWSYVKFQALRSENLLHAIEHLEIVILNREDISYLREQLNELLNQIDLPEL